jgi:phenylpropionate dioxygenase-like ring-hydroxylating dioxygenase large terminal subunit
MRHELQQQLVKRVLAHLEGKTTDSEAAMSTRAVAAYTDPAIYERERAMFRAVPVPVGHVSQLAVPGAFITHDATGVPLLVVRGDDGELGAFLNVCRHRGTRLADAPCGEAKAFVCPYHAWSYSRSGSLLGMPHERGFSGVDRDQRGLVRVPVGVAGGLVFVRPSAVGEGESAVLDAAAWLGPIADDLASFGLATSHVYAPSTQVRTLGWKLAIDVFLEAYHLRPTHHDSIYKMFFDNVGLVDPIGPHLRNVFPKRTIRELAAVPETEWVLRRHANVLYHLFPNTLILVEPDHAAVLHLWPLDAGRTLLTSYTLIPEPAVTEKARAYWDANNAILYNAVGEDFTMGESIQRGLASGANREVVFGAFEHALAHFHRQVDQRLGS